MAKTMKNICMVLLSAAVISMAVIGIGKASAEGLSDDQKADVQTVIEEYLMENPEIIIKAIDAYRTQQQEAQKKAAQENIAKHMEYFNSDAVPVAGNPDGEILVVEFFDYNCGYCKRAFPDVVALIESNDNVRVVFQEMPILGPTSLDAAQWAEAAKLQGKYFEFHQALMETKKPKNEKTFTEVAEELGLDIAKLKDDAESEDVQNAIEKSMSIAREIGISGTPAFIVGDQLYPGYLGEEALKAAVAEVSKDQ